MGNFKQTLSLLALSSLAACGAKTKKGYTPEAPVVTGIQQVEVAPPKLLKEENASLSLRNKIAATSSMKAVVTEITLAKSEILDRVFLYGSDLQYSAIGDPKLDLTLQSMALGHVPARFRIVGSTLQLVADQTAKFESDINHPERLLHEFPIVRQDEKTITVVIAKASPTLVTVIMDQKAGQARTSWVRSLEYVEKGNYLLFETSIEAPDGSIAEVMESLFPRDSLVPAGYKPLLADPEHEPLAKRYGFLDADKVFLDVPGEGRVKTAAASRYLLSPEKPIEWYVTPNVPDAYLPQIKSGVEGWNRYFQAMFKRDVVVFKGTLPEGVKIGDPRYNVINWDNVAEAGAAYESQATDPETGIQSHSLIYLPLAWVNIGKEYWDRGGLSDAQKDAPEALARLIAKRSFLDRRLPVNCLEDPTMKISLEARMDSESFALELLKNVLFHEMGHALGLAHNFKGSLVYDPSDAKTAFSTSIMDYNQYAVERGSFDSLEGAGGPLLEYDRQILSVLYNEGKDVKSSDPVLPACADEQADDLKGGVDPLCLRYDVEKDPTVGLANAIRLLTDADFVSRNTQSLPKALADSVKELGSAEAVTALDVAAAKFSKHAKTVAGLVNYYVASGANSVNYLTRANLRSLYVFKPGALLDGYDADGMRSRAMNGLNFVAGLDKLPAVTQASVDAALKASLDWLLATEAVKKLPDDQRDALVKKATAALAQVNDSLSKGRDSLLSKVRARVLTEVKRVPTAPFYMKQAQIDYEAQTLEILERVLTTKSAGVTRSEAERTAVAKAMLTYKDITEGEAAVDRAKVKLGVELTQVPDALSREEIRSLLKVLDQPVPKAEKEE